MAWSRARGIVSAIATELTPAMIASALLAVVMVGLYVSLIDWIPPKDATLHAMGETFFRIGIYGRQRGALPPSLSVLPNRTGFANQTTDAWTRPLIYEVTPEGIIVLTSLGKDGKPGGRGDSADITRAYHAKRPDGSLWVTSENWSIEAEARHYSRQRVGTHQP